MKSKKQIKKRNQRILIISILLLIVILIVFNLGDVVDGLRDGARAASGSN